MDNYMEVKFPAISENEALARLVVSAFVIKLDPETETLADIKTAVSEAVTNAIIHGYNEKGGEICLRLIREGRTVYIEIEDKGCGIEDIRKAMEPMFTTKADEERTGLGFTVMESFMDEVKVESIKGFGTVVKLKKLV